MAPPRAGNTAFVPSVEQAPCEPICLPPEPPAPLQVLSDQSPNGGSLQYSVLVLDRAVPLRLSPGPSSRKTLDQDKGGSGGRGHRHRPQLAEEVLVPTSPPDGVQDPIPAPMLTRSSVTTPA